MPRAIVARGCRPWLSPGPVARPRRPAPSPGPVARPRRPAPSPGPVAVELLPVAVARPRGCRPAPWLSPGPVAVARPRKIFGILFDFVFLHCMLTMLRETNN